MIPLSLAALAGGIIDPTSKELNYVVINNFQTPGRAKITGLGRVFNYDVQQLFGMSGAQVIYRGRAPSEFTITIELWEPEHFIAWGGIAKLLEPPTPFKPLVCGMAHPQLATSGISKVAIRNLGTPERQDNGMWVVTIQCLEYLPPIPAAVKPRGAVPNAGKGVPTTPETEADKELVKSQAAFEAARDAAR